MGLNYYASSPTVVLPPQQTPHYFNGIRRSCSPFARSASPSYIPKYPMPPSLNYLAAASNATAGRKRSLADIEDPDEQLPVGSVITQVPPKPKAEPIYGPGMTLIYPDEPGLNISPESQTGTWAEAKHDEEEKKVKSAVSRPIAISRKSQRLEKPSNNEAIAVRHLTTNVVDEHGNTMDALIKALGIGWKTVMPEAARAYARYIENHYELIQPEIMVESEGRSAYLIRATYSGAQQFLLFDESLAWCQHAGSTLPEAVHNLNSRPHPWTDSPKMTAQSRSNVGSPTPLDAVHTNPGDSNMANTPAPVVFTPPMDICMEDDMMQM